MPIARLLHRLSWVYWCYSISGLLHFGDLIISPTSGVQQGDPLRLLLFSLTMSELLKSIKSFSGVDLQLRYLDDGTLIGPIAVIARMLREMENLGPSFGLHLNDS